MSTTAESTIVELTAEQLSNSEELRKKIKDLNERLAMVNKMRHDDNDYITIEECNARYEFAVQLATQTRELEAEFKKKYMPAAVSVSSEKPKA